METQDPTTQGTELQPTDAEHSPPPNIISSLPPVDGGRDAWLMLAAGFLIETLIWGFPFSFGVVQAYYSVTPPISTNTHGLAAVGTVCSGIMYLAAPVMTAATQQGPVLRSWSSTIGLLIVVLALVLSSWAVTVWQLILTQGILYAIGGGLLYYPALVFIDEWFIRRKSLAYGFLWAGTGVGGLVGPLVLGWGLNRYGAKTFLRAWALTLLFSICPLLFFVKPRVPWSGSNRRGLRQATAGYGFVKMRAFWILAAAVMIQGLGYFIPSLYIPDYAHSLGLSKVQSSAVVSVLNTAGVPGVITLSLLSDHINAVAVMGISALGSAIAVFLFWGLTSPATSLPLLFTFAVLYGFFAGGFSAIFASIPLHIQRMAPTGSADLSSIIGLLSVARGIGNVACGPLSESLLVGRAQSEGTVAYNSYYSPLIYFTGATAVLTMAVGATSHRSRNAS